MRLRPIHGTVRSHSRGVTLLELLIVMTIMLMITAAAIPMVAPAFQNRQMRESGRLVSSFISGARSRAIETGRSVGVKFQRFRTDPMASANDYALALSYVEVPAPYAGDTFSSQMSVSASGEITGFVSGDTNWNGLLRWGDLVKLNFRGQSYYLSNVNSLMGLRNIYGKPITNAPSAMQKWFLLDPSGASITLPPGYANGVPFQVFRQPAPSSSAGLQLPEGIVVDLAASGFNTGMFGSSLAADPIVVFGPNGSVEWVNNAASTSTLMAPTGSIFFLLGRRELMSDIARDTMGNPIDKNLSEDSMNGKPANLHLQNFWIAIGYQTGLVTIAENATNNNNVANARLYATQGQSVGGR